MESTSIKLINNNSNDRLEAHARFSVIGEKYIHLPDLTDIFGLKPTEYIKIGERVYPEVFPSKRDLWVITESRIDNNDYIEKVGLCLNTLLDKLINANAGEKLINYNLVELSQITIGGICNDIRDSNMWYSVGCIEKLFKLGVKLGEDFY